MGALFEGLIGILVVIAVFAILLRQNARLGALEREIGDLRRLRTDARSPVPDDETPAPATADRAAAAEASAEVAAQPVAVVAEPADMEAAETVYSTAADSDAGPPPDAPGTEPAPAAVAPKLDIETAIGTRWAVWVGGLALALGALFLIRYSIEAGIFGPEVRLVLAGLFGVVLAGAGEIVRRTGYVLPVGGLPGSHVPAILTAAGAFALFGTVYAAHGLYGFIGPGLAFPLLGLIALAAIASALLHGQALAGIGLVGAMATPALIASTAPNHWALFVYLAIVLAAAVGIARLRYWPLLAGAAFAAAGLWGLLYLGGLPVDNTIVLFHHTVHLGVLGLVWLGSWGMALPAGRTRLVDVVSVVPAIVVALVSIVLFVGADQMEFADPARIWSGAAIAVGALALALWRPRALALVYGVGAALFVAALRLGLAGRFLVDLPWLTFEFDGLPVPPMSATVRNAAGVVAVALIVGAAWAARRHVALYPLRAAAWTAWAAAAPLLLLAACWIAFGDLDRDFAYAGIAALLAIVLAASSETTARAEVPPFAGGLAVSAALAGAFAAAALMLHMAFGPGMTTVLVAGLASLAAAATRWRGYAALGWIAVAVFVLTVLRVALDPTLVGQEALGATPVFNWLLPGYGLPALAFAYAAWQLARTTNGRPRLAMEAAAALFALLCAAMLVRHAMNGGVIDSGAPTLAEQAIYTLIALGGGGLLVALDQRAPSPVFRAGSLAIGVLSALFVVAQHFLLLNPLLTGEETGQVPFFNLLLLGYLLPAVAAAALALFARPRRPRWFVALLALLSATLAFAYATLSLRRLFHGESIALWRGMGQIETYSYSALWLALGVALLVAGTWLKSQVLRLGSGVLIAIAVAKVFLFDMSELEGVLRALSFIGLGAVLIGIGLFYQRLLMRARAG